MTRLPVRRTMAGAFAAVLASVAVAPVLEAQAVPTGATPITYYRGVVGLNPLGIPFDIFSVEAEGAVAPGITIGGAASYFGPGDDDDRFTSGDFKVRYYPGETALDGFSVGLGLGVTKRSGHDFTQPCVQQPDGSCDQPRTNASGPTLSILTDYNFLLGPRRRFFVGTGVGAKRWLVSQDVRESVDAERAWVFARFLLGMAF